MAIYPMEIASHSFAMTSISSSLLNPAWYEPYNLAVGLPHSSSPLSKIPLWERGWGRLGGGDKIAVYPPLYPLPSREGILTLDTLQVPAKCLVIPQAGR